MRIYLIACDCGCGYSRLVPEEDAGHFLDGSRQLCDESGTPMSFEEVNEWCIVIVEEVWIAENFLVLCSVCDRSRPIGGNALMFAKVLNSGGTCSTCGEKQALLEVSGCIIIEEYE